MQQHPHRISVRLNDLLLERLEAPAHSMGSNHSEIIRLALTLLFSRKLRGVSGMSNNIGVL